jgi:hypothetical protein
MLRRASVGYFRVISSPPEKSNPKWLIKDDAKPLWQFAIKSHCIGIMLCKLHVPSRWHAPCAIISKKTQALQCERDSITPNSVGFKGVATEEVNEF